MTYSDSGELFRLLIAIGKIVDSHTEVKVGHGVVELLMSARDMKELRSAFEPFRGVRNHARAVADR